MQENINQTQESPSQREGRINHAEGTINQTDENINQVQGGSNEILGITNKKQGNVMEQGSTNQTEEITKQIKKKQNSVNGRSKKTHQSTKQIEVSKKRTKEIRNKTESTSNKMHGSIKRTQGSFIQTLEQAKQTQITTAQKQEILNQRSENNPDVNGSHLKTSKSIKEEISLKKNIGLVTAIGIVISNVIGSGIFISPQGVLRGSGSVALSLIIWVMCGILSLFGALTYAELGTLINDSGGTYIYLLEGFAPDRKKDGSHWKALPAFLYNWQNTFFVKPAGMAIISLTCAKYLVMLSNSNCSHFSVDEQSTMAVKLIAAVILCSVAAINCYSVKFSANLQITFASLKLLAIAMLIVGGICVSNQSSLKTLSLGFQGTNSEYRDVASAFYSGLWAYNGWQNLNYITNEMKNPMRDLPLAIIPANLLVVILYLMVNVAYLLVMSKEEMLQSETVAVGFGYRMGGRSGEIVMIVIVAVSTLGSATSGCFTAGRLCNVAAREGHMISALSFIHKDYFTPTTAVLFNLIMGLMMIVPSDIDSLISLTGFTAWLFIGATQVSLLIMRRTKKNDQRALKVNIMIPVVVLLFSSFLVVTPILDQPSIGHFYVLAFLFLGLLAYIPFVHLKFVVPGTGEFSVLIQKLLHVLPPQDYYTDQ